MVKETETILSGLETVVGSIASARELLEAVKSAIAENKPCDGPTQRIARKKYILDTLAVTRWHRKVLMYQHEMTEKTVSEEISGYNQVIAKAARSNQKLEARKQEYERLKASVSVPLFLLSYETLTSERGNEIMEKLSRDTKTLADSVDVASLFTVEKTPNGHQRIDYGAFQELVELEYRSRIRKRIKLELLSLMIARLESNSKKWMGRERSLAAFMRRLREMAHEVNAIKTSESSDLHEFDYEEIEEIDDEIEEIEEHEEIEDDIEEIEEHEEIEDDIEDENDAIIDENALESGTVSDDSDTDPNESRVVSAEPEDLQTPKSEEPEDNSVNEKNEEIAQIETELEPVDSLQSEVDQLNEDHENMELD